MKAKLKEISIFICLILFIASCKKDENCTDPCELNVQTEVQGFGLLERIQGIWNGPVSSPTALGSFPEWIVDFRAVSSSQIAAKNELDSVNDIFMSFFIAEFDCSYKLVFRNGGSFAGLQRISYMVIDSVYENQNQAFYRFVDPVAGAERVYTDINFSNDSLIMHTYTNVYNTLNQVTTHMLWQAQLSDLTSAQEAQTHFNFPQKALTRDFTHTFDGLQEAVFYTISSDPFPDSEQPYLGSANITVNINNPSVPDPSKKVLIIISTQPLFNGFIFNQNQLKYRSRYVLMNAATQASFNFDLMHPGSYCLNAVYDNNGDSNFSSGDFMNGSFDLSFNVLEESLVNKSVSINFEIP